MAKKVKQTNAGMASKKVRDLLDYHVDMLSTPARSFHMKWDEAYYLNEEINSNNSEDYVKIGYTVDKKLLSRTYNMEIKTAFHDVDFAESYSLKIKFSGFPKIEATYFKKRKQDHERYEQIYNDAQLIRFIQQCAQKVDIGYIKVNYDKKAQQLTIVIAPYAGALLWLLFPPIFNRIPLRRDEMEILWELMVELRRFVTKLLKKERVGK